MFANPFDGPRAKVARARKHLAELIDIQLAYRASKPVSWDFRVDTDKRPKLFLKIEKMPPEDAAPITSDILGNLRSSLDLAVCAAAQLDGATNLKNTYFHFAQSETEWDKSVKGRTKAAPKHIVELNRALAPWEDGDALLYALSRLAATDKHQLLVPIASTSSEASIDGIKIAKGNGELNKVESQVPRFTAVGEEIAMMTFEENSGAIITGPINITPGFAFGDVDVVPYTPVIVITNRLCGVCENIINLIEKAARRGG